MTVLDVLKPTIEEAEPQAAVLTSAEGRAYVLVVVKKLLAPRMEYSAVCTSALSARIPNLDACYIFTEKELKELVRAVRDGFFGGIVSIEDPTGILRKAGLRA